MSYKTILVHVNESRHTQRRVVLAAKIAAAYDAHLVGIALSGIPMIFYDPMMLNPLDPAIDELLQAPRQRAAEALANFERIARQHHSGSIETRLEENDNALGVSLLARYCDLVVLGQYDRNDTESYAPSDFAETVILHSGVPVLMVPFATDIDVDNVGRKALVSWDASKEATRAVHYAMPMLQRAAQVDVAVFDDGTLPVGPRAVADQNILQALQRHGVLATVTHQETAGDIDIGNALLSLASDLGSNLLVMGCYGHARFREILLGGVTRQVLRSMTLPVLMTH